jgi:hypothetical protein
MTARYRDVFTGLGDPVIDISDEEDESDVSKADSFSKEYFARHEISQLPWRSQITPDPMI